MQEIDVFGFLGAVNDMVARSRRGEAVKPVKLSDYAKIDKNDCSVDCGR